MSHYQEKNEDFEGNLESLHKIKDIYSEIYGLTDKKTIKIKRMISLALLRNNKNEEALSELLETEVNTSPILILAYSIKELEKKFYGDDSVQVAKTQKIIGTLYLVRNQFFDSKRYLQKAKKIFEANKFKKTVSEINKKLRILKNMKEREIYDEEDGEDEYGEEN